MWGAGSGHCAATSSVAIAYVAGGGGLVTHTSAQGPRDLRVLLVAQVAPTSPPHLAITCTLSSKRRPPGPSAHISPTPESSNPSFRSFPSILVSRGPGGWEVGSPD